MADKLVVGYYSQKAFELQGESYVWADADGNEYTITGVSNPENVNGYVWKDKIMVCDKLVKFVRVGVTTSNRYYRKGYNK